MKSLNSERTRSARAQRVWQRLTEWYGERFTAQYGRVPPPDWCEAIDDSSNELVKRALSIIRAECVDHPPTFPQFAKALRPLRVARRDEPTIQDRLCMHVATHCKLTDRQRRGPWTYIFRPAMSLSDTGKELPGVECVGVLIPADGESPGQRIMVADMLACIDGARGAA